VEGRAQYIRAGHLEFPIGDAVEAFVDADDIAAVAVAALNTSGHAGKTYTLSGPRALSAADLAADLSEATGRTIKVTPTEPDLIQFGAQPTVTDDIECVLGRQAKDFADFARQAAATGIWG
jgi:uncharacterized protein YbjT (DUF2867 family)